MRHSDSQPTCFASQVRIPPLLLLIGSLAVSRGLKELDPVARPSAALRIVGALLGFGGLSLALVGVVAFHRQRTTVDPRHPERAETLVSSGVVYSYTRNPMYLGFVGTAVGGATWLGSVLALAGPLALAIYLDRIQIPVEERALRNRFGTAYVAYTRSVRRWLGRRAV